MAFYKIFFLVALLLTVKQILYFIIVSDYFIAIVTILLCYFIFNYFFNCLVKYLMISFCASGAILDRYLRYKSKIIIILLQCQNDI